MNWFKTRFGSLFVEVYSLYKLVLKWRGKIEEEQKPFLRSIIVARTSQSPPFPSNYSPVQQFVTLSEIVNKAIEFSVKTSTSWIPKNIIAFGFRKQTDYNSNYFHGLDSIHGIESFFPNTIVNVLKNKNWERCLTQLGDSYLLYLFIHCFIFVTLPNRCFAQLTGAPLGDLVRERKTILPGPSFTISVKDKKHDSSKNSHLNERKNSLKPKKDFPQNKARTKNSKHGHNENKEQNNSNTKSLMAAQINQEETKKEIHNDEELKPVNNKKFRLSNWRRNKLKKSQTINKEPQPLPPPNNNFPSEKVLKTSKLQSNNKKENSPLISITIPRTGILYNSLPNPKRYFPKTHFLFTLKPTNKDARKLIFQIFNSRIKKKKNSNFFSLPKRFKLMIPIFRRLIKSFYSIKFKFLLHYHCPLNFRFKNQKNRSAFQNVANNGYISQEESDEDKFEIEENYSYQDFQRYHTLDYQVSNFVKAVCRKLIPRCLWGSFHNQNTFFKHLDSFIRLRRYETFSLHELMQGIKINHCKWVNLTKTSSSHPSTRESLFNKYLVQDWIYWLFTSFIIPLLKINFYCTETNSHKNRIFYFRNSLWLKFRKKAMNELQLNIFQKIPQEEALSILQKRSIGFSFIRILPKSDGIRPILNFGKKMIPLNISKESKKQPIPVSINSTLQNIFHVLNYEKHIHSKQFLGSSIFGFHEIYEKIVLFIKNWRKLWPEPRLYFCAIDIKHSFDTINQETLFNFVEEIFSEEQYLIQKYMTTVIKGGRFWVNYCRSVCSLAGIPQFSEFANKIAMKKRNCIITDQVVYSVEEVNSLKLLIKELIFNNLVKDGADFYRQKRGIAQGSILSPLLCSLYYAKLEEQFLNDLPMQLPIPPSWNSSSSSSSISSNSPLFNSEACNSKHSHFTILEASQKSNSSPGMLLRLIDDFLYVTTSLSAARTFVTRMEEEVNIPPFNVTVNKKKTKISFNMMNHSNEQGCFSGPKQSIFLPWCGYLINVKTFEFQIDYSRHINDDIIDDSLTVQTVDRPGYILWEKMMRLIKCRCHPLTLDTNINSMFVVRLNIFQVFLFVAIKFHCYVQKFSQSIDKNFSFFIKTIFNIINGTYDWIKQTITNEIAIKMHCNCPLTISEVKWLGLIAFHRILKRKQTKYHLILHVLYERQIQPYFNKVAKVLEEVINPIYSSIFDGIKF